MRLLTLFLLLALTCYLIAFKETFESFSPYVGFQEAPSEQTPAEQALEHPDIEDTGLLAPGKYGYLTMNNGAETGAPFFWPIWQNTWTDIPQKHLFVKPSVVQSSSPAWLDFLDSL